MLTKHWVKLFVMASFVLMVIIISCSDDSLAPTGSNLNGTLTVTHISPDEAPVIGDNDLGFDFAWSKAETLYVVVEGPQSQLQVVRLLGLTDGEYFYMMASWNDPTRDVKPDHVLWIDKSGVHARTGGQDFFYAIFADESNGDVGASCGQGNMCHSSVVDIFDTDTNFVDSMRNTGPGMVDAWMWKSGQTDPVGSKWGVPGTLIDMHFPAGGLPTWDATVNRTPPLWDFNAGVQDSTLPRWMHPDSNLYVGDFLLNSEKIPFSLLVTFPDSLFDTTWVDVDSVPVIDEIDTNVTTGFGFQKGAEVPGYVLADSVVYYENDSRFEVVAKGTYDAVERRWYLEMKRKLNTGFDDDIPFGIGERIQCTIGVTNSPVGNSSMPHFGREESFYIQF